MTFLETWGCASDFLEMLPKFKKTQKKFVDAKIVKLKKSEIIQILVSHSA